MSQKINENSTLKSIQSFEIENINEARLFKGDIKSPKKAAKSLS